MKKKKRYFAVLNIICSFISQESYIDTSLLNEYFLRRELAESISREV